MAADWLTCGPNENSAQSVLVPRLSDTTCGRFCTVEKDGRTEITTRYVTAEDAKKHDSVRMWSNKRARRQKPDAIAVCMPLAKRQSQAVG